MNVESDCPCCCLMKLDLQKTVDKLAFLKDNWPSFSDLESISELDRKELICTLCFLDIVIDALAKEEFPCPNREIIRLVITRTFTQNCLDLCEFQEQLNELTEP